MINNTYDIERLINNRLAELRAEGMRSQMIARASLPGRKPLVFSVFRQFVQQTASFLTRLNVRWVEQPKIRETLAHEDCG